MAVAIIPDTGKAKMGTIQDQPYFNYSSLLRAPLSVRLCRLHRGLPGSPIRCDLSEHILIDAKNNYDALSYAWNSDSAPRWILLNGKKFKIQESLMGALQSLRQVDDDMVLWVDALCINQADDQEKKYQVPLMDQVYLNAAMVRIWLGPLEGFADRAFDFLESLEISGKVPIMRSTTHEVTTAIKDLCSKNYWTRGWIVQEVLVAKSPIIYCGSRKVSFSVFGFVIDNLSKTEEHAHLAEFGFAYRLHTLRKTTMLSQGPACFALEDLLALFGSANCYYVQDKIFSMLGLTRELVRYKSIIVDYSQNIGTLFTVLMRLCMPRCPNRLAYLLQHALGLTAFDIKLLSDADVSQLSPVQRLGLSYLEGLQQQASYVESKSIMKLKKKEKKKIVANGGIFKNSKGRWTSLKDYYRMCLLVSLAHNDRNDVVYLVQEADLGLRSTLR